MVKRLIQGLLLGLLAVHINVYALGLGEIQLDSALNQPLSATIELLSTTPEDADSIRVSLASYETFSKVGIDRPAILTQLRFHVASQGGGYVINIDSAAPIREPFLDFILEVTWSSGRVLREYTLLLDPPEFKRAQPARIQAPVTRVTAQPQPQKRAAAPKAVVRPKASAAAKTAKPAGSITPTDEGGVSYGPVRDGETLWSIAREMRQGSSVSTQQTLMMLLDENPNAFIAGDINRLKRGSILRLNNPDVVASISHKQAVAELTQRAQPSATRRPTSTDKEMSGRGSAEAKRPTLKLVTPDLKSSSEKMGATVAEGDDNNALRQELMLALEISEAQRRENDALKERMSDLQKQLDSLKRLITLKDGDLAQVQQQLAQSDSDEVVEVAPQEATEEMAEVDVTETSSVTESAVSEIIEPKVERQPATQPQTVTPAPAPVAKPVTKPDFVNMVLADPMLMTTGGGALILLLLLILLIIRRRGNRFHESILSGDVSSIGATATGGPDTSFLSDLAISGLAGDGMESDKGDVDPIAEADVYMAYGRLQQAESLLNDVLKSDPERMDIKGKLLEVYFAAKNKDQFDAMIAESGEQLQEDDDSWKKILVMGHDLSPENPLFAETPEAAELDLPNGEAEDTVFDDVLDIGIDLDELSAEMESSEDDLDIDLGLDFSDLDDDIFSSFIEDDEEGSLELDDLDLDLDKKKEAPESSVEAKEHVTEIVTGSAVDDKVELDFDLGELDLDKLLTSEDEPSVESATDSPALDFELATDESDDTSESSEEGRDESAEPKLDDLADLDLDFESIGTDLSSTDSSDENSDDAATADQETSDDFDLDLEQLGKDLQTETAESVDDDPLAGLGDLSDLDLDFDMDDDELDGLDTDDLGIGEAEGDMDTKIDLAKAYIEMGDADGARNMLNEVVAQGDDNQKQQAQDLLDSI